MTQWVRRSMERRRGDDAGFTLVELVVAMMVTLIVMAALLGVFVESLSSVTQAKQRQASTALATQAMEELRALPYDDVTLPDGATLAAGDPNIDYVTPPELKAAVAGGAVDEPLVVNALSPLVRTSNLEGVTYTLRQYVSAPATAAGAQPAFNVTVIVTWTSNVSPQTRTTIERSTVYSPDGCLSTTTRPFSGPCQAFFTGQAGQGPASVVVTAAENSTGTIPGFNGSKIELGFTDLSANLLLEQTTTASTAVGTTDARRTTSQVDQSGGMQASAAVDSDPSSVTLQEVQTSTPAQTSTEQVLNGSAGSLRARPFTGDTGQSRAAVAAAPELCRGLADGALQTGSPDRRPCASGAVRADGSEASIVYDLASAYGYGSASLDVARIGSSPQSSRAVSAHLTTANTQACTQGAGPSGVGCVHSAVSRELGDVLVGGLPGAGAPGGFNGSWRVSGLRETATAERGVGAGTPAYVREGTLTWWQPTAADSDCPAGTVDPGYSCRVLTATTSEDIVTTSATATFSNDSEALLTITVSSTITVRPAEVSATGPADCLAESCIATASGLGTVRGQTTYTVAIGGVPQTSFVVVTDLSGLLAQSSYKAAPSA